MKIQNKYAIRNSKINDLDYDPNNLNSYDVEKTRAYISSLSKYENNQTCPSNETPITFKAKTGSKHTMKDLKKDFEDLFLYLKHAGVFLLKHKSVDPFPKTCCQNRFRVYSLNI